MLHYALLQLRRITSSGRFVPEIDGLRFAAITSVVVYHLHGFVLAAGALPAAQDSFRTIAGHGYRGVNLFYVISGFILGLPFAAHHLKGKPAVPLESYFLRRLTRLEPPYIVNLLICFALLVASGASAWALAPHLGASLLYVHSLWFGHQSVINPVAWTLEIEVQFYCLVPVLASIFLVRSKLARRTVLVGVILLAGIAQIFYWDGPERIKLTICYAIQFFLTGLLLADVYVVDWNERPSPQWRWDLVSLLCWPLIFVPGDRSVWVYLPFLMLAAYVAAFKGVLFNRLFRNKFITAVGGMCYTIYLFHYQLITAVLRFSKRLHPGGSFDAYFAVQLLVYAPILLLISCFYFALVERPCMARDWPRRLYHRIALLTRRITGRRAEAVTS
jgi:peptidoglycan/LPS O-acetylase OafA/YrhL